MTVIRLYDKPECPFCWKVRLACSELGLAVEIIDHQAPARQAEWREVSPNGTVPVLRDGGVAISESNVILEYLQDLTGSLLPDAPAERARARLLNHYSDTRIGQALRQVIFEKRGKDPAQWDQGRIAAGVAAFHQALPFLADQLGERDYFAGRYSLPECALTARFGLAEGYGVAIPEAFPTLQAWFQRMKERPSYRPTRPRTLPAVRL